MNDIDKLDGMIKIKGKCGYEIIGGCKELRKYKQALEEIRENILSRYSIDKTKEIIARPLEDLWCIKKLIDEVLNDRD